MQLCDKNTIFALNGNAIKDISQSKIAITNNGVTVSQTQSKNFKNALYFDGSSRLLLDPINFGGNDFTIDWWEYVTSSSSESRFCSMYTSNNYGGLLLGYNGTLAYCGSTSNSWNMVSGVTMFSNTVNEWVHWAVVRNGTTLTSYRNGVVFASKTISGSIIYNTTYKTVIGDYRSGDPSTFIGYIDSFRISNVARWTSAFTPPEYEIDLKVKTNNGWTDAQKAYVKTADNTWIEGKFVYVKANEDLIILDYIESTGTQYIDTLYRFASENVTVEVGFEFTTTPTNNSVFGSEASGHYSIVAYGYGNTNMGLYVGNSSGLLVKTISTNTHYDLIVTANNNILTESLNGSVTSGTYTGSVQNGRNITIFANNIYSGISQLSKIKLKYFRMKDNGVFVRDYIPVLDSNGTTCLYDKVTNQLFYNQGTGEFVAGYKTEFEPETELAFLESTGTQYIDTGFKPNQDTRVIVDCEFAMPSSDGALFGARITSNNCEFVVYGRPSGYQFGYGSSRVTVSTTSISGRYIVDANKNSITMNGMRSVATVSTFSTPVTLYLFAYNNQVTGIEDRGKSIIYSCKIYDNGILIRDYIPKTDNQGVPALFDKVSQTYYYNAGTGTFKTGTILKRAYWKQVI